MFPEKPTAFPAEQRTNTVHQRVDYCCLCPMSSGTPALCGEFAEPEPFRFPTIFLYRLSSMSFLIALSKTFRSSALHPSISGVKSSR